MTSPELKRYACSETGGGEIIEWPNGEYVRFADVEAYTQAAIAAAMMGAAKVAKAEALCKLQGLNWSMGTMNQRELESDADDVADSITSAIPTDATAALEEIKRQVWNGALEAAARLAVIAEYACAEWSMKGHGAPVAVEQLCYLAATIRAMKGGE
jgi:hypothetical protein